MDVMVELHGLWDLPCAIRIVEALQPYAPFWIEDPIDSGDVPALTTLAQHTPTPLALSETLAGRRPFARLLETGAAGIVIVDLSWVGGLTEGAKIAALADTYSRPLAPHDCTGPVVLTASTHLSVAAPNGFLQESVRAYYSSWYGDLVTALPSIAGGQIAPSPGPGLGTALHPDVRTRPDVTVRSTRA